MLAELQNYLTRIYQVDPGCRITDFLVTDPTLAAVLGRGSIVPDTEESVLLAEHEDGVDLCLYLDRDLLQRLAGENPMRRLRAHRLKDLWTVLEGISHFNYLAWSARRDRKVTLMELEMQAEVDKFVSTLLLALSQEGCDFAHLLHKWLFEQVRFNPGLDRTQRERYETANSYAGRFCHGLLRRLLRNNDEGMGELRHFYRLSQPDKISHIHSQAYAQPA